MNKKNKELNSIKRTIKDIHGIISEFHNILEHHKDINKSKIKIIKELKGRLKKS